MMPQRDLRGPAAAFELKRLEEKLKRPLDADERLILEERRNALKAKIERFRTGVEVVDEVTT